MPTPAPSPSSAVPSPPLRICNVIGIFGDDWEKLPRYGGHHLVTKILDFHDLHCSMI